MQKIINGRDFPSALAPADKSIRRLLSRQVDALRSGLVSRKTSVLLIVADDMGYGDLVVFSEGRVRTPHLDRLLQKASA